METNDPHMSDTGHNVGTVHAQWIKGVRTSERTAWVSDPLLSIRITKIKRKRKKSLLLPDNCRSREVQRCHINTEKDACTKGGQIH